VFSSDLFCRPNLCFHQEPAGATGFQLQGNTMTYHKLLASTAAVAFLAFGAPSFAQTVVTMNTVQIFGTIDPAKISDYTDYMYLGDFVEFGETEQVFFKPKHKETEDYITGRFG
jgi:hypothetical protein